MWAYPPKKVATAKAAFFFERPGKICSALSDDYLKLNSFSPPSFAWGPPKFDGSEITREASQIGDSTKARKMGLYERHTIIIWVLDEVTK